MPNFEFRFSKGQPDDAKANIRPLESKGTGNDAQYDDDGGEEEEDNINDEEDEDEDDDVVRSITEITSG